LTGSSTPRFFYGDGTLCSFGFSGHGERTPADSLICGYGFINRRRVAVIANDFTVLTSTNVKVNLKKLLAFKKQVKEKMKVPLIFLGEAGGAHRIVCPHINREILSPLPLS
jgi:acetyl-CoA carboxylase carboxyltransferase component